MAGVRSRVVARIPAMARRISRQLSPAGAWVLPDRVSVGGRVTAGAPVSARTSPVGSGVGSGVGTGVGTGVGVGCGVGVGVGFGVGVGVG
jgi:hypothetical protein